jgi:hypothetical protein
LATKRNRQRVAHAGREIVGAKFLNAMQLREGRFWRAETDAPRQAQVHAYFNELLIDVNLVLSFVPSPFTATILANAMPVAINADSMAVAPDSYHI